MNATDTRTPADFPMPDLHCPTWCERDHAADWQQHVAVGLDTRLIPAAGGGFLPDTRGPIEEWCSLAYFEPLHLRVLSDLTLNEHGESARVDVPRGNSSTTLYVTAEGPMTAEQARRYAAELIEAADVLDGITR